MRERLDKVIVKRGLAPSREAAQALIEEGKILVRGMRGLKASSLIEPDTEISITGGLKYVSRGGLKLEAALDNFGISLEHKKAIDVGASTGGFTDCLLQRGIEGVYCIDVGYGQLAWKLRQDKRVVVLDRVNARDLSLQIVPERVEIAVIDVSFISLKKIIPSVVRVLKPQAEILALVKPQFEVGKGEVGRGGIVRDEEKRLRALRAISESFLASGLNVLGTMQSPITGYKGNIEYFIYARLQVVPQNG